MKSHCQHPSREKREKILQLIRQCNNLFDGTLRDLHTNAVHLELKKDTVPKYHKAFPVIKMYEETLKKELERLCSLAVLKHVVILHGQHIPSSYQRKMVQFGLSLIFDI